MSEIEKGVEEKVMCLLSLERDRVLSLDFFIFLLFFVFYFSLLGRFVTFWI